MPPIEPQAPDFCAEMGHLKRLKFGRLDQRQHQTRAPCGDDVEIRREVARPGPGCRGVVMLAGAECDPDPPMRGTCTHVRNLKRVYPACPRPGHPAVSQREICFRSRRIPQQPTSRHAQQVIPTARISATSARTVPPVMAAEGPPSMPGDVATGETWMPGLRPA